MPRPNMVRADTLDLQSHKAPSAQDHHQPGTLGDDSKQGSVRTVNGFGASQATAMRNAAAEDQAQAQQNPRQMGKHEEDELERELAEMADADDDGASDDDDDDMMDKMSSSPSIIDEDIDFELVYALHSFNATVEGQANVSKGEHMVLLDDSNSYWWLVRIVRDSSIGYLPAEHIETPPERQARLNKYRNIDLAANMLSDNAEHKSKNPLKQAMRRRGKKSVAFTSPTYIEASDYEWSDDDEDGDEGDFFLDDEDIEAATEPEREHVDELEKEETVAAKVNGAVKQQTDDKAPKTAVPVTGPTQGPIQNTIERNPSLDTARVSEDGVRPRPNPTPASLRHPDSSIFQDDSRGTVKLTLTPNLLRDSPESSSTEIKGRTSMDREKHQSSLRREEIVASPPPKETKKLKKGGSVLGNLFKKRSKKGKNDDDDIEEWIHGGNADKQSIDSSRSSDTASTRDRNGSLASMNSTVEEARQKEEQRMIQEQAKMQEHLRIQQDHKEREMAIQQRKVQEQHQRQQAMAANTIRRIEEEPENNSPTEERRSAPEPPAALQIRSPVEKRLQDDFPNSAPADHIRSPITAGSPIPQQAPHQAIPTAPQPVRKTSGDQPVYQPRGYRPPQHQKLLEQPQQQEHPQQEQANTPSSPMAAERLSESPEQITFHDATDRPDLVVDTSSGADSNGGASSVDSSPDFLDSAVSSSVQSVTPPAHTITRTWSDWSLKTYLEDDTDVRDMLIVVRQDRGLSSTGMGTRGFRGGDGTGEKKQEQHPQVTMMFEDSNKKLQDITKQLDGMLGDWLSRRSTPIPKPVLV